MTLERGGIDMLQCSSIILPVDRCYFRRAASAAPLVQAHLLYSLRSFHKWPSVERPFPRKLVLIHTS